MSEQFNNKDYGEYFSAIEKQIKNQSMPTTKASDEKPNEKKKNFSLKIRPQVYVVAILLVALVAVVIAIPKKSSKEGATSNINNTNKVVSDVEKPTETKVNYFAEYTSDTEEISSDIVSQSIIVINCKSNQVVASRNATERCYPASTTKIMTMLTAVDYIIDYNDTFTFSYEVTDPFFEQGATIAGFKDQESVNMTDMLYGAILPSGADATAGLAIKIAGSEEAFVKLMNKKAEELNLKDTHFTNASGLFNKEHYTTAEDMAVIIRAAMQNELCKKILSTYQYTTAATPQNPDGIPLTSTLFSYMYGTEPEGSDILGGKTGFVNESGYCIASFGQSDAGTEYVCVTLKGQGLRPTVFDQINLYTKYAK
ncbi:MAG: D-alanyl-D-alanine carboxypeptidase [Clostridia bacterium]|nr:D-alanyl-D-alanine carboxypeptidase [Clostridia bacterium]